MAVASVLLIVPDFGLHLLMTRDLVVEPKRLRRSFWSLLGGRLIFVGFPERRELSLLVDENS